MEGLKLFLREARGREGLDDRLLDAPCDTVVRVSHPSHSISALPCPARVSQCEQKDERRTPSALATCETTER